MSRRPLADAFGLPARIDELYRRALTGSGGSLDELAASMFVTPDHLVRQLSPLLDLDIVRIDGDLLTVASPVDAVSRYVASQAATVADVGAQLNRLAAALPVLADLGGDSPVVDSMAIDGEVLADVNVPDILQRWIVESPGDICSLRPDQWRMPSEPEMALAVSVAAQAGRRVRAIYPARALQEAPAILSGRAAIGERIRVLPEVPTRMAIVGATRAMIPDLLGVGSKRTILIRQQGIVQAMTAWFNELWDSATAVTTLDRGEARPDLRRLLLTQLAAGAKDEQIARTLNLSLRTVRRRIATLMSDLGVDTRFQAGAEAARRGWL